MSYLQELEAELEAARKAFDKAEKKVEKAKAKAVVARGHVANLERRLYEYHGWDY